jgi:hypothetical protein
MKETGFVDGSHLTPADTINDGILSDVFGVTSAVCRTPDNDGPSSCRTLREKISVDW